MGKDKCIVYTRVMGYHRPVESFNIGKKVSIDKELNLLSQKIVYDYTKFTTTDYTGEVSCIVWHISCNLKCSYCYNDNIVFKKEVILTMIF